MIDAFSRFTVTFYFRHMSSFRAETFELASLPTPPSRFPSESELRDHEFWLMDNSRFWFYREQGNNGHAVNLPCVLVTDTGINWLSLTIIDSGKYYLRTH